MARGDYIFHEDLPASDKLWQKFHEIVASDGFKSSDKSFMDLAPTMSKSIFAIDREGNFVSCVVWHENDDVAFIAVYLTAEKWRGRGIGRCLWDRALFRIPDSYTIALRTGHSMLERYKADATPFEGPKMSAFNIPWKMTDVLRKYEKQDSKIALVKEMSKEDYVKFEAFDELVTGRNRRQFLRRFHDLPFTSGACLFNDNGDVIAYAAIVQTSTPERHLYKLGPIYASSLEDALTVSRKLIDFVADIDPEALITYYVMTGTIGEKLLQPILISIDVPSFVNVAFTLFSKAYENPIKADMVFAANNNSCHYDI